MRAFFLRQLFRPSLPCRFWLPLFAGAMLVCSSTLAPLGSASPATPVAGSECHLFLLNGGTTADMSVPGEADSLHEADWSDLQFIDLLLGAAALSIHRAGNGFQQAGDPDVRRIALRILESQAGEAKLLRFWRETWFPDASPIPPFDAESARALDATACTDSNARDAWLLSLLVDASERAASTASFVSTYADRPELRNLAAVLLEAREAELRTMRSMLEEITTRSSRSPSSSSPPI